MKIMVQILLGNRDEQNRVMMSGTELYAAVKAVKNCTRYVLQEASGRLKAIGFHNGVQKLRVDEARSRTDGKVYYYQLRPERLNLPEEEKQELLTKRRK